MLEQNGAIISLIAKQCFKAEGPGTYDQASVPTNDDPFSISLVPVSELQPRTSYMDDAVGEGLAAGYQHFPVRLFPELVLNLMAKPDPDFPLQIVFGASLWIMGPLDHAFRFYCGRHEDGRFIIEATDMNGGVDQRIVGAFLSR
ncbi:MAG TPA: hypothetical protein VG984_02395 [Candidatus Paceibacterota bacterium]|nr:hypothetical protein [Candidatus Paceibacterota bacterium]